MHQYARDAAAGALAANTKGKFWEFHKALYKNMRQLDDEKLREISISLGLDADEIAKIMNSKEIQEIINQDMRDGEKARLRATPSVYVNGKLLKNHTLEGFQEVIDAQLKKLQ